MPSSFQSSPQDPKRAKLSASNKAGLLLIVFQVVLYRTVHFSNATFSLRAIIWNTSFNYFVQPILENTGLVLLVQVYWSRLRLSPSTLPQGDKTSDQYLWPGGNLCILKLLKVRLIHAAFEMLFDWGVQVLPQNVVFWRHYCCQGEMRSCVM